MLPVLRFVVGGTQVSIALHALAVAAGIVLGAAVAVRRARDPALVLAAVAVVAVAALAGAHALFVVLHGDRGVPETGGLVSVGGIAAGIAAAWVSARLAGRPSGELLDAIAPAGLVALGIGRLGCFLAGCCAGQPTTLPWGVVFPELGPPPRHPLQLYSATIDVALAVVLARSGLPPGRVAARCCVAFGLARVALETLRDVRATDPLAPGVTLAQVFALVLAAVAATRLRAPSRFDYASGTEEPTAWPTKNRSKT